MAEAMYTKPYLDTNVYITLIKGPKSEPKERVDVAAEILELAEKGEFQVAASTFIAAEVVKAPQDDHPLTSDHDARIEAYFSRDFIVWYELDLPMAKKARQLARDHGMKPPDAVHVAAALRARCDQFLTWDERLHKNGRTIEGLRICEPHLAGRQTSFLPPTIMGHQSN